MLPLVRLEAVIVAWAEQTAQSARRERRRTVRKGGVL